VFAAFAKMETRLKEYERARVIYKVSSDPIFTSLYGCPAFGGAGSLTSSFFLLLRAVCSLASSSIEIRRSVLLLHQVREAARNKIWSREHRVGKAKNSVRGGVEPRREQLRSCNLPSPSRVHLDRQKLTLDFLISVFSHRIPGSPMLVWRRTLTVHLARTERRRILRRFGISTRGESLRCRQVEKRGCGGGTSSCGCSTLLSRRLRPRFVFHSSPSFAFFPRLPRLVS